MLPDPDPDLGPGHDTVAVRGRAVRVSREGSGPPLLLINGLGGTIATWDPLRPHLQDLDTIAFDAPGSGGTPNSRLPMTIPAMARMTGHLLDALDLDKVDVLGFSLGGLVAQQLAWSAPGRVRRLVLMSTNVGWASVPGDLRAMRLLFSMRRLHDPDYYAQVAPGLLGGAMRRDGRLVRMAAESRVSDPQEVRSYLWQLFSCASWSTLPFLPLIRQPTLVVNGDDDPLARPVNARMLARLLPRGRLHMIAGGGHHLVLERPAEIAAVVHDFIAGPPP